VSTQCSDGRPLRLRPRVEAFIERLRAAGHEVLLTPIDEGDFFGRWYDGECRQFLSTMDVFVSVDGDTGSTWMGIELDEASMLADECIYTCLKWPLHLVVRAHRQGASTL